MSEIVEFFNELTFGSGAWFGIILILGLAFLISYKAKYSSMCFILILIFMGFNYLDEIGGNIALDNSFCWAFVIDMMGVLILGYIFLRDMGVVGKR